MLLAIDNRVKMCQLVKGRRALQSIVGEYEIHCSRYHEERGECASHSEG